MAIDLVTGEHFCIGLYMGSGCESCRKKYPHIKPLAPEEQRAFLDNGMAALTGLIDKDKAGETTADDVARVRDVMHPQRDAGVTSMVEVGGVWTSPTDRTIAPVLLASNSKGKTLFAKSISAIGRFSRRFRRAI